MIQWALVTLGESFRCGQTICDAANKLATVGTPLRSYDGHKGEMSVSRVADEKAEAELLSVQLQGLDPKWSRAVLLRTNALVERYADLLRGLGVPVRQHRKLAQPPDWSHARRLIALLAQPANNALAHSWLIQTVGRDKANSILLQAIESEQHIGELLGLDTVNGQNLPIQELPELLKRLSEAFCFSDHANTLPVAFAASEGHFCAKNVRIDGFLSPEASDRIARAAAQLDFETSTMADLAVALDDWSLHETDEGQGVFVGTIHSAKGREFDAVFLPALEEGILPSKQSLNNEMLLAEERRLLYVGITRARHFVALSCARHRANAWTGKIEPATQSRFY